MDEAAGRGWQQGEVPSAEDAAGWFAGRLPDGWFTGAPEVTVDREEIVIVGELPALEGEFADDAARAAAEDGPDQPVPRGDPRRAHRDRAPGRAPLPAQSRLGREARRHHRAVHHLSAPVMTRLRQPERLVLDTLVDAASRARARRRWPGPCAWSASTPTPGSADLREAMTKVDDLRAKGPDLG